jgi:arsenate reductase (thioredoxin)
MAEGYLRYFSDGMAVVFSAGIETHGVNPRAVSVMLADGIDISHHTSNNVNEYLAVKFDFIITVCDHANEVCPVFPSSAKKFHFNFPDPAKVTGVEEEIVLEFRRVRELIKVYCKEFVTLNF